MPQISHFRAIFSPILSHTSIQIFSTTVFLGKRQIINPFALEMINGIAFYHLSFTIGFDEAQTFYKSHGYGIKPSKWHDLTVEVYI